MGTQAYRLLCYTEVPKPSCASDSLREFYMFHISWPHSYRFTFSWCGWGSGIHRTLLTINFQLCFLIAIWLVGWVISYLKAFSTSEVLVGFLFRDIFFVLKKPVFSLYFEHLHRKLSVDPATGEVDSGGLLSPSRGIQTFGISGPHRKGKSCLGPYIKYIVTCNHTQKISMF